MGRWPWGNPQIGPLRRGKAQNLLVKQTTAVVRYAPPHAYPVNNAAACWGQLAIWPAAAHFGRRAGLLNYMYPVNAGIVHVVSGVRSCVVDSRSRCVNSLSRSLFPPARRYM